MEFKSNLYDFSVFALKSWIGRKLFNSSPKLKDGSNYLNLGCGNNVIDGYVNADFYRNFRFWRKDNRRLQWQLDLRFPLKCADDVFDGIYTEHTLEHLYPDDAKRLLAELYRIVRRNSMIRITVPDLEKYVRFYNSVSVRVETDEFKARYRNGCVAIRDVSQNYFHCSLWDFDELKCCLEEIGFRDIRRQAFSTSEDPMLNLDQKARAWETLYVEARK